VRMGRRELEADGHAEPRAGDRSSEGAW
jgi:hypothetical protein